MNRYGRNIAFVILILSVGLIMTPIPEFDSNYSKVIYDKHGDLLGAHIAVDEQWRFPAIDSIPDTYLHALLTFEDKRYFSHIGIDFRSLLRAIAQNIKSKKIISGASTITMQVCRMSRGNKSRTISQKLIEMCMAIKTELLYTKEDILRMYVSHAPFGGNVVGLEAATWRYFGKSPELLSLSESTLLAVLPNAPSYIHTGKNRGLLRNKRNKLLSTLLQNQSIDSIDYELALLEEIPPHPLALPRLAPHLLHKVFKGNPVHKPYHTSIDPDIQRLLIQTANIYHGEYSQSDIQNLAVLVLDTKSGEVLGYLGNAPETKHQKEVDMILANRSSGSILKPLLYAHALEDGIIAPSSLLKDIPSSYRGYSPKNYNREYQGAVSADVTLSRSLNVPFVELLSQFKVGRFKNKLRQHGLSSINRSVDNYGLTLILGGAEVNLWELTSAYASLGRVLLRYKNEESRYDISDYHIATTSSLPKRLPSYEYEPHLLSAANIFHMFLAMQDLSRPDQEGEWQSFNSSRKIAWKTGTSFGHRDAWAIGCSPQYTIGIWVGNADGEGKHNLMGVKKAGPILFDIVNHLEGITAFPIPYDDLTEVEICAASGFIAGEHCDHKETGFISNTSYSNPCPYHRTIFVDNEGYRVHGLCHSTSQMSKASYLVLPVSMASYYRKNHPNYKSLPNYRSDCQPQNENQLIKFIYPQSKSRLYLPTNGNGEQERAIFKVAHQDTETKLFWHHNDNYLGMTDNNHTMSISGDVGLHSITVIDQDGNSVKREFEIVGEN